MIYSRLVIKGEVRRCYLFSRQRPTSPARRRGGSFGIARPDNVDLITDFTSGTDKLHLDAAFFTGLPEGPLSADNFVANAPGTAETDRHYVIYNTTTGALFFDAGGNGSGAAIQFATLEDKPELKHTDFVVAG